MVQSQEATDIGYINDGSSPEASRYTTPFTFVIPRWALAKRTVPDQCLALPPSMSLGAKRMGSHAHETYAEPNISYHVRAILRYRTEVCPEAQTIEVWKEILFMPITTIQPPINVQDFPAEFVESQIRKFQPALFGGPTYPMTFTMTEPSAVKVKNMQIPGSTWTELNIIIIKPVDSTKGSLQLPPSLQNLTFNVESVLRTKTFYSLSPFAVMPGQALLTTRGNVRFKDESLRLPNPLQAKPFDSWRRGPLRSASSCSNTSQPTRFV